jgi:pyruvate/2-oxoglutarate dehydrogenase complex dihydrolipoamide acyltransferase (E2) component
MDQGNDRFTTAPFPALRRLVVDAGRHWRRSSVVYGLVEFDITLVRGYFHAHKERTGETLSLTAYVAACLARAVAVDRSVHAYRNWRGQLVIFDDVDVSVMVEVPAPTGTFPMLHVLRAADKRGFREIHDEIRDVQAGRRRSTGLGGSRATKFFVRLPLFLRELVYWYYGADPMRWKRQGGTIGLTTLGMFGKGGGWGIPLTNSTLTACVGGIAVKPAYVGEGLERREFLDVTVGFNHDIVDGGPAARFVNQLKELVETGTLLVPEPAGN